MCSICTVDNTVHILKELAAFIHNVEIVAAIKDIFSQSFQGRGQRDGGQIHAIAERSIPDADNALGNYNAGDPHIGIKQRSLDFRHALGNADFPGSGRQHDLNSRSIRPVDDIVHCFQAFAAFVLNAD